MDVPCYLHSVILILGITIQGLLLTLAKPVSEIEICQHQNKSFSNQLHIKSPGFPNAWTGHAKCQCYIHGHNITIGTRTLVLTGFTGASVLQLTHDDDGNRTSWPRDNTGTYFDDVNWKIFIATKASNIKLSIDTSARGSLAGTVNFFMFDFQANEDMHVSCQNLSSQDKKDDDTAQKEELLEQIGSVCSPYFVIILGSLCCSLLLIILIISVILCCVIPRKRREYTIDHRNQLVTDERKLKKAAKSGRDSIIYDEAKINLRASAAYGNALYDDNKLSSYSNTGPHLMQGPSTMPTAWSRQSAQYVNTADNEAFN